MAPDVPSNRLARVLGGMLLGMGALHFAVPKPFDEIVPPGVTISSADAGYQPPSLTDPFLRRRRTS